MLLWQLPAPGQQPGGRQIAATAESEEYWNAWMKDLYQRGVEMEKDSIRINAEAKRILTDSAYRRIIYPQVFSWPAAQELLKRMELKIAFWYLVNLYMADTANRKLVLNTLIPFDQLFEMDKVLTSTFYTYALLDPSVCAINNGRPEILHPDRVEVKFHKVKEIIGYIQQYRKQKAATKKLAPDISDFP